MSDLLRALDARPTGERARIDFDAGGLVGTRCTGCGWVMWPERAGCARCGEVDLERYALPADGVLHTWTRVWVPAEGIEPPYVLGMVRLGDVRVFAHIRELTDELTVPAPVRITVCESAHPQFWFTPAGRS
ncbi:MAG: hypothetical protein GEU98_01180 [Pseudonocardiaceae bacterium]|nr:hypothetical protein [Pseudonocardiaceae bacterium]